MMARLLSLALTFLSVSLASSQAASSGYVGYNLQLEGDKDSVIYSTDNTRPNVGAQFPKPDVYLNASVSVGEIDIEVDNLTAKINLEAQVLSLLTFNAGVDLSIDQVKLSIEKVQAKVLLEARLENLVRMINTTLSSIDLNPVLATLGEDLGDVLNTTAGAVGGLTGSLSTRSLSFELEQNILYSTNNYRASKHTNRILAQNGDIVDHYLNNGGDDLGQRVVGSYSADMTPVGEARTTERNGIEVTEREYVYQPFPGLSATCSIYFSADGKVVGTQIVAESSAGGSSTISDDENDL